MTPTTDDEARAEEARRAAENADWNTTRMLPVFWLLVLFCLCSSSVAALIAWWNAAGGAVLP